MDVLIVDDERTFAELLAERLRLRGYAVRVAGTAEAALEQMEDAPSDEGELLRTYISDYRRVQDDGD